jgi:hypothetical protein
LIAYLFLGLMLLTIAAFVLRWFARADAADVALALRWGLVVVGAVIVVALLIAGRATIAALLGALILPLLRDRWFRGLARYWMGQRRSRPAGSGRGRDHRSAPGRTSEIATRFVTMTLDHDTGEMHGVVREGPFRGRALDDLDLAEQVSLWAVCSAEDEQSATVLEAYLDRQHGPAWREAAASAQRKRSERRSAGDMTKEEARQVLGVGTNATAEEIRRAHRELMQKYHPDHGGSPYFAAKLNQARDLLLGD